jgi:hypothetical protein
MPASLRRHSDAGRLSRPAESAKIQKGRRFIRKLSRPAAVSFGSSRPLRWFRKAFCAGTVTKFSSKSKANHGVDMPHLIYDKLNKDTCFKVSKPFINPSITIVNTPQFCYLLME